MSKVISWFQDHRIDDRDNRILQKLEDLGATEVSDLVDLEEDDILTFQPPFLKKLEFSRFKRAIVSLQTSTDINLLGKLKSNTSDETIHEDPPLPPSCPERKCIGTLSSLLGKRRNKHLIGLKGPDFRWIISCSHCATKWHACHFLCGHIARISPIGSSDIIRHEQGRFNRWLKQIKTPCANNPQSSILKNRYNEARSRTVFIEKNEVSDRINSSNRTIVNSVAPTNLIQQPAEDDIRMLGGVLNEESQMNSSFDIDDMLFSEMTTFNGNITCSNNTSTKEGTSRKRVKLTDGSHTLDEVQPNDTIDNVCCQIEKLMLDEFEAGSANNDI